MPLLFNRYSFIVTGIDRTGRDLSLRKYIVDKSYTTIASPINYRLTIELIAVFGLSASRGSGAARHCEERAKEAKAARCPKTRPPGREGTKVDYKTISK